MAIIKKSALENAVAELIGDSSQKLIIDRYYAGINSGFYDSRWVETVFQHSDQRENTKTDAAIFACIWTMMHLGFVFHVRINLGLQPEQDKEIETNKAVLDTLPKPFTVKLWGKNFQQDGTLLWDSPIEVYRSRCGEQPESVTISERESPLEIGYTEASTSFFHLKNNRCLARWPYGHDYVTLLLLADSNEIILRLPERLGDSGAVATLKV